MPKFIATSGSYFEPFSYEQLVAPVAHMQQAHDAAQNAYEQINLETSALEKYITDNPEDAQAKALYDGYMKKLETLQNNLWNNGVNAQTKRDLAAARQGYASDIARLQTAIQTRQQRSQEYWKTRHNNPNLVAGADPGTAGLDAYLNDDNYGQNWWSYDAAQFEADMANETIARAKEMLRGLTDADGVVTNPKLAGILTRVVQNGFTNGEVQAAGTLVDSVLDMTPEQRNQYYTENNVDPVVQLLSESLINRYDATGIRGADVSDTDKTMLLNRGKAGLARGVLGKDIKDFSDPYFELRMKNAAARYAHSLTTQKPSSDGGRVEDTTTTIVSGESAGATREALNRLFGPANMVVSQRSGEIRGGAQASDVVYSGNLRREAYRYLGFDIGRDPDHFASKDFLTGEIIFNGKVYETQYNPKANGGAGAVKYREKGSGIDWNSAPVSPELTRKYNDYRSQYLDNINYYKNNEPDVYRMASVNPDKQHDLYSDYGVYFSTPLTNAEDYIMSQPQNRDKVTVKRTYVARGGTDSGKYIDKVSGWLSESIPLDSDGSPAVQKGWRAYNGQAGHIHEITRYGTLDDKAVTNPGKVFTFKDGQITNISSVQLDADAVLNGYLVVGTTGNKMYGVGLDMINSDELNGLYATARQALVGVLTDTSMSETEKDEWVDKILSQTSVQMKNILGYYTNTQSQGGTSQENRN